MKFLRHAGKVIGKDTRRNMPVKSPVSKKSSESVILKSVTVLIGEISKKLPSGKSGGSVQEIFQKAQEAARKSVKATEKLRQKAPPQIQSAKAARFHALPSAILKRRKYDSASSLSAAFERSRR